MARKKALRSKAAYPTQPPSGADMSALIAALNEARTKLSLKPHVSKLPLWKRWIGGEGPEYDGTGLRDVVNANAQFTDAIKANVDNHGQRIVDLENKVRVLQEAPVARPFP